MKIRWFFFCFGSFTPHFQIKLSIHGSNLNSTFIIMSELIFFLLTGVLTQTFNIVDLVKFLEKNQKPHILIVVVTLNFEGDIIQNHEQKRKVKNQDSMGKKNFFFSTLPFSPWAVLATWLHVGAPQKIQEK
jgi:hypothetical protein